LKYALLIFWLLRIAETEAQKLVYDIFLFGGKIGQSVVERTKTGDTAVHYSLNSNSEAHIFFSTRKISLHYEIDYRHGQLYSSYSKHTRNDESHITLITRQGNRYLVKKDTTDFYLNSIVDCSTVKLFYAEPCSADHVLSERLGEFRSVKKLEEGVYTAEMSEGITYTYHYKNGKLVELEMKKGLLGSIYLRLQQ
jgi:hypothetical protein